MPNDAIRFGEGRDLAGVLEQVTTQKCGGGLVEP
jgi:hypothetical protein